MRVPCAGHGQMLAETELIPAAEVNWAYSAGVWLFFAGCLSFTADALHYDPVDFWCLALPHTVLSTPPHLPLPTAWQS